MIQEKTKNDLMEKLTEELNKKSKPSQVEDTPNKSFFMMKCFLLFNKSIKKCN